MPVHHSSVLASLPALTIYLLLLSTSTRGQSPIEHEPVEHLKAHLPKRGDDISGKLELFLQAPPEELKRKTAKMNENLRKVLNDEAHVSAFLVKGSTVLSQRAAEGIQFNSTFLLPHAVLLPILSTTLPILLEGYKPELLTNPMGDVLRGKHREHSSVKDYLSFSLHDLTTKLPQSGNSVHLDSPTLLPELNRRGKAAFFYLTTVLGTVAEDAWRDALISVAMDYSVFSDKGQMLTHLKDVARYAEALGSDMVNFFEVSKSDLHPVDGGHFLYGWWFNCPRGGGKASSKEDRCLAPFLPSNAMAVLHNVIRMYTVPRLNLHLLIANSDKSSGAPHTLVDVLAQDRLIWDALYSVVDPSTEQKDDKKKSAGEKKEEDKREEEDKRKDGRKEAPAQPPLKAEESQKPTQQTSEPETATEQTKVKEEENSPPEEPVESQTQEEPSEGADAPTEPPPEANETVEPQTVKVTGEPPKMTTENEPERPTELPEMPGEKDTPAQETPPEPAVATPANKKKTAKETVTKATEDEVVGESTPPRKKPAVSSAEAGTQSPPVKREEDEVVEEDTEKVDMKKEGRKKGDLKKKSLLVWAIYKSWPVFVFLFYTILSHIWVYWIVHLVWLVCSTLFSGVYLPRPKTAKED